MQRGRVLVAPSHSTTGQETGARMRSTDFKAVCGSAAISEQLKSAFHVRQGNTEEQSSSCSPNTSPLAPRVPLKHRDKQAQKRPLCSLRSVGVF